MRLRRKRAQYLLVTGVAEVILGLSYGVETTPSRAAMFDWLPFGLQIGWVGWLVSACGFVVVVSSALMHLAPVIDRLAWSTAAVPTVILTAMWVWTGMNDFVAPATSKGWTPWASAFVYGMMCALVLVVSDWPDPVDPASLTEGADR